jgi:hypothetical protein
MTSHVGLLLMKLPGSTPSPWSSHTNPTAAAIAARTKRVRSLRGEPVDVTGVGCSAMGKRAFDRRR